MIEPLEKPFGKKKSAAAEKAPEPTAAPAAKAAPEASSAEPDSSSFFGIAIIYREECPVLGRWRRAVSAWHRFIARAVEWPHP